LISTLFCSGNVDECERLMAKNFFAIMDVPDEEDTVSEKLFKKQLNCCVIDIAVCEVPCRNRRVCFSALMLVAQ